MPRNLTSREQLELERELEDSPTRRAVEQSWAGRQDALLAYRTAPDLGLLAKAAQQDVQIAGLQDEIESLRSQRRWLLGGLGVSVAAFLLLVIRRRPRSNEVLARGAVRA